MAEYYSKEAVVEFIRSYRHSTDVAFHMEDHLYEIPAADVVERKQGRWIGFPECLKYTNAYSDDHIVCSACEECFSILDNDCERFNFCPNCGADMREPPKEE